jgi:acetyl-CoA synthetase
MTDLSTLRLLGSVGEPSSPKARLCYHTVIGGQRCAIVVTWWQTGSGAIMITALPGLTPAGPGSVGLPLPGASAVAAVLLAGEGYSRQHGCTAMGWPVSYVHAGVEPG